MRKTLLLGFAAFLTACATAPPGPPRPARINHLAFFKLNDPADANEVVASIESQSAISHDVLGDTP